MHTYTIADVARRTGAVFSAPEPGLVYSNGRLVGFVLDISALRVDEAVDLAREAEKMRDEIVACRDE